MNKPKHIQQANYEENNPDCKPADIEPDQENNRVICLNCGQEWVLNPSDLEIEVNKPSMERARIRDIIGDHTTTIEQKEIERENI